MNSIKMHAKGRSMQNNQMEEINAIFATIRKQKPIVHHLTNYVTANDCANGVLALGGSPIMADEKSEVEEIVSIASSLVLNIGTANQRTLESMILAGKKARDLHLPIILDPVGSGASAFRTNATRRIIEETAPSILRGNMSEILSIYGDTSETKGVDASQAHAAYGLDAGKEIAKNLARKLGCIVAITGKTDIVTDGNRTFAIHNGHSRLANVTGTGCMCTSLVGTCCGVTSNLLVATVAGILRMGLAGELAQNECKEKGESSFHISILDHIGSLDAKTISQRGLLDVE
jgi:hydroxyethylthiazole kinase